MFKIGMISIIDAMDMAPIEPKTINVYINADVRVPVPNINVFLRIGNDPKLLSIDEGREVLNEYPEYARIDADLTSRCGRRRLVADVVIEGIGDIVRNHVDDGSISIGCMSIGYDNKVSLTRSLPGHTLRFIEQLPVTSQTSVP